MSERTESIECSGCHCRISSRMAWRCSKCGFDNHRTEIYSFFYKCQKCQWEPGAVVCPQCERPIPTRKDVDLSFPARSIPVPKPPPPPEEDAATRERREYEGQKIRLEREIELAKLKANLSKALNSPQPAAEKSAEDELVEELEVALKQGMALENAVARVKQRVAEQFKDDPDNRERNDLWIEKWRERRMEC